MSSSPSPARVEVSPGQPEKPQPEKLQAEKPQPASSEVTPEMLPFFYREAAALPGQPSFPLTPGMPEKAVPEAPSQPALATEREAQVREAGRQQGGLECRAQFEEQLTVERGALAQALKDFARDRGIFYRKIEEETVRLALRIARQVLHREAQVDPFLLMGMVSVALERMEGATGVTLLVHPQRAADWRRYLTSHLDPGLVPEVVEDAAMSPQQCSLRTAMGTADLGLEVQLKEIEQGLMDLLAARPGDERK